MASRKSAVAMPGQISLPDVRVEYKDFGIDEDGDHGEVFTRRWVVDLILDLSGYYVERPLHELRLVEPSCGSGAFLTVIAARLSASCRKHDVDLQAARPAIRACDLLQRNVEAAKIAVAEVLLDDGWSPKTIKSVVDAWIVREDFLLSAFEPGTADFVVGNPPYIRIEDLPVERNDAYRAAWPTMGGRADIYVGFLEKGLSLLKQEGRLGFICADRWMRNQYGTALRERVAGNFSVEAVISMHDVDAFDAEVQAYPAVTILANRRQQSALVVDTNAVFGEEAAREIVQYATEPACEPQSRLGYKAARLPHWFSGRESWPQGSPERLAMIERLSDNFPPLQSALTGTRVGIGVATGADGVFVVREPVDVEPDRLIPLSMVRDIATGTFKSSGHLLVNPWNEAGLVDLSDYPKLAAYFGGLEGDLRKRNIAARQPRTWFRTIDRVDLALTAKPKLLIQDMRLSIFPVLDDGTAYPHHNLYYVVSDKWEMTVLGGLLMSDVANAFIEAYAVKMRGGTLRFQAQYLRRIRVPKIEDVSEQDCALLSEAFARRDVEQATAVALRLYGLTELPE